jgi:hypothetical protein
MTKQERQQILLSMKFTAEGKAMKDFLDEKLLELDNIESIVGEVQLEAHKSAKKILRKLFSFFYENDTVVKSNNPYE